MFEWAHYKIVGDFLRLHANETTVGDAALRSSVSRYYYSAYHYARLFAERKLSFAATGSGDDHSLLRTCFKKNAKPEIARKLEQLHTFRKICDYEDIVERLPEIAVGADDAVKWIYRVIGKLPPPKGKPLESVE